MPRRKINPDVRAPNSPWAPSRVYGYLCQCFRRPKGNLALSQDEFVAARGEYVRRAVQARFRPRPEAMKKNTKQETKRKYYRQKRISALDSTPMSLLEIPTRLYRAEFPWIILKGEFRNLKKNTPAERDRLRTLMERYSYLPMVKNQEDQVEKRLVEAAKELGMKPVQGGLLGDLKDMPYKMAFREVADELGIKPDSLERMLSPSARRRAGTPPWLARSYQRVEGEVLPPIRFRRHRRRTKLP